MLDPVVQISNDTILKTTKTKLKTEKNTTKTKTKEKRDGGRNKRRTMDDQSHQTVHLVETREDLCFFLSSCELL
jgi:hypothetical protein